MERYTSTILQVRLQFTILRHLLFYYENSVGPLGFTDLRRALARNHRKTGPKRAEEAKIIGPCRLVTLATLARVLYLLLVSNSHSSKRTSRQNFCVANYLLYDLRGEEICAPLAREKHVKRKKNQNTSANVIDARHPNAMYRK